MKKVLAVLVVLSGFAHATSYYVRTDGSDSNNGLSNTAGGAKLTLNGANAVAVVAGDVVHVQPGTYNATFTSTHAGTSGSCVNTTGVSTSCITYVSDVKWGAKVRPVITFNSSYVRFQDFEIDGTLSGNVCCGIDSAGTTGLQLVGNKIHDTSSAGNATGNCVICVDAGAVGGGHHLIQGNFLYHNNGGYNGVTTANNSGQHGIYSELSGDVVDSNIVVDQGGGWCIHGFHIVDNWTVVNNTMANCQNGGIAIGGGGSTQNNTTIINNVVVNSGSSATGNGGINFRQCGTSMVGQNNGGYGNVPSLYVGTCSGITEGGTQVGSNASFVNYTGSNPDTANFHLATGSVFAGTGTTTCAAGHAGCVPAVDFDGAAMSNPPPIGAYTASGAAPAPPTGFTATVR